MTDIVETEYDLAGTTVPLRPLDILGSAIAPLREQFTTHINGAYSIATSNQETFYWMRRASRT